MSVCEVGRPAPGFSLPCVSAEHTDVGRATLRGFAGRWLALIFYPRDFSFVCPTELTAFSAQLADFVARKCELLGISVDTIELHREWLNTPPSEGGLGRLRFPLASDTGGQVARAYGVWVEEKEISARGLFLVDPQGILQYSVKHNLSVGRRPDVVLRVLDALQSGGLCPANWTSADGNLNPETALRPGRSVGRYRIRRAVGSGSFGSVFAAWDLRLERMVALKVLKRNVFESRQTVLAEARAAARLASPNVCTIYSVDEEDGLPLIAMEYLDGVPLSQLIEKGLEQGSALALARQIAAGLADAHECGIVHGDLKPANVIVTGRGVAKIVDFGLATAASRAGDGGQAKDAAGGKAGPGAETERLDATVDFVAPGARSTIRGTPAYMSPEQASALPATLASDVYSLGLLFFELFSGRPALAEQSIVETLQVLQNRDLGPELAFQVEKPYQDLLLAMLARDATRRATMGEVVERLAEIDGGIAASRMGP